MYSPIVQSDAAFAADHLRKASRDSDDPPFKSSSNHTGFGVLRPSIWIKANICIYIYIYLWCFVFGGFGSRFGALFWLGELEL